MKSLGLFPFMARGIIDDFDTETEDGIYDVNTTSKNNPEKETGGNAFIFFSTYFRMQIYVPYNKEYIYLRYKEFTYPYLPWKKINI